MSSPYFPELIGRKSKEDLQKARALVEGVIKRHREDAMSGDDGQFDNAFYDGGAIALLELASKLIKENGGD